MCKTLPKIEQQSSRSALRKHFSGELHKIYIFLENLTKFRKKALYGKVFFEWYFKSSGLQLLYKGFYHWRFPANLWNKKKQFWKLWQIHRKTLISQFLFNNVADLQLQALIKSDLPTNIFHKVLCHSTSRRIVNCGG